MHIGGIIPAMTLSRQEAQNEEVNVWVLPQQPAQKRNVTQMTKLNPNQARMIEGLQPVRQEERQMPVGFFQEFFWI
jgi:hypothetical protein